MKTKSTLASALLLIVLGFGCGPEQTEVEKKIAQLDELRGELSKMQTSILKLEAEIESLDSTYADRNRKSILVTSAPAKRGTFEHFVEITGSVLSKKNIMLSAETVGRVLQIPVSEGMQVSRGAILARLDGESIQRNIEEVETSLDLASTVFEKQKRLWDQEIGTEMQFLEAKNRKESLEKSLASLRTQLNKTVVRAPFSGTIERVEVRAGELVQPGTPLLQLVGERDLFIEADISESFVGILDKGDSVDVFFPSLDFHIKTRVTAVGAIINPNNRTFKVEVSLPSREHLKPNMLSVLKINDYENANAVLIPNHLILSDNQGDYVFVIKEGVAHKTYVKRGGIFENQSEILEGLEGTEVLVDKGFREVTDKMNVELASE